MNNAMQLKAIIKKISKDKHISAQLILQNYMLERLLERISVSPYQSNRKLQWQNVSTDSIYAALTATAEHRNTLDLMAQYPEILQMIMISPTMNNHWIKYQNQFEYAKDIQFNDICTTILEILDSISWSKKKSIS